MSFETQLANLLDSFFSAVADKYNASKDDVRSLWMGRVMAPPTLSSVDTTDVSNERLLKSNKAELVALCKSRSLKCSGTKDELMERLRGGSTTEPKEAKTKEEKVKVPTKKADRAIAAVSVIQKLTKDAPTVPLRKNAFQNYEHPPTRLVFDTKTSDVIGTQNDAGHIDDLTDEDIQNCKKYKFTYKVPSNLEKNTANNVVIKELDDLPDVVDDSKSQSDVVETLDGEEEDEEELEDDEIEI